MENRTVEIYETVYADKRAHYTAAVRYEVKLLWIFTIHRRKWLNRDSYNGQYVYYLSDSSSDATHFSKEVYTEREVYCLCRDEVEKYEKRELSTTIVSHKKIG